MTLATITSVSDCELRAVIRFPIVKDIAVSEIFNQLVSVYGKKVTLKSKQPSKLLNKALLLHDNARSHSAAKT